MKYDNAMIFSPKDGSLQLSGCDLLIIDGLAKDAAMAGLARFYRSELDHQNSYSWLRFGTVRFGERPADFSLCFQDNALVSIHFGVSLPDDKLYMDWPTEETSKKQVAFIRSILKKQLARSFTTGSESFPWGGAWARFDPKGFMASAGLNYASWTRVEDAT